MTPDGNTGDTGATAAWPMYRALVGIGMLCGLLIVSVYEVTKPIIAANQAEALQAAIFEVLPDARTSRTFAWSASGGFAPADEAGPDAAELIYAGYGESGRLVGFAIEGQGMGYQDVICVLYGYAPEHQAIIGIKVLDSRETPGLGDKIEKDPAFLANFERLDVSLAPDGEDLANPIAATKHGEKTSPWQVDAITGATISSFAIADILQASASVWVPRLTAFPTTLAVTRAARGL